MGFVVQLVLLISFILGIGIGHLYGKFMKLAHVIETEEEDGSHGEREAESGGKSSRSGDATGSCCKFLTFLSAWEQRREMRRTLRAYNTKEELRVITMSTNPNESASQLVFPSLCIQMAVRRRPGYYVTNIIAPNLVLCCMSVPGAPKSFPQFWAVFSAEPASSQNGVCGSCRDTLLVYYMSNVTGSTHDADSQLPNRYPGKYGKNV